jgi:hypothetical protein
MRSLAKVYMKIDRLQARMLIWRKPQSEAASGDGDLSA